MKKFTSTLLVFLAATMVSACGGGGDDPAVLVATSDLVTPVNSTTAEAVLGENFVFPSGVPSFGTTSTTTVQITSTSTFTVTSAEGMASGDLSYGSCIFSVLTSSFASNHPLATGRVLTQNACTLGLATEGLDVGHERRRGVNWLLGGIPSLAIVIHLLLDPDGLVRVRGVPMGTVPVAPAHGSGDH